MHLTTAQLDTPMGPIRLVSDGAALRALEFDDHPDRLHRLLTSHYGRYTLESGRIPNPIASALKSYFDGDLAALDTIPVATGGSAFQRRVWAALRRIPPGTTTSYGALAATLGQPGASRAVGLANGANPVGIVVPCHRVIGSNGTLTGYGGGLPRKQWLLEHEGAQLALFRSSVA
jgi:methylated-DNA-[protein]-cysteine S-methyltransferase